MKAYRAVQGNTPVVSLRVDFLLSENDLTDCLAAKFRHKTRDGLPDQLSVREATDAIRSELWGSGMFADDGDDCPAYVQAWAQGQVRRLFGPVLDSV